MITKIGILCPYEFPEGMAPTTRIIAYGKGLVQNGVNVEVVSFSALQSVKEKKREGVIQGIKYTHPYFYNPKLYGYKLYRILYGNLALIFACLRTICKSNRQQKYDWFLLSYDEPRYLIFYSIVLRLLGIKVAFIGDEFPEPIRQLKERVPTFQILEFKLAYRFIQRRILMTRSLQEYYDKIVCPKPTFILSSVIDTERFLNIHKQKVGIEYLCYMGNMMLAKDNVDNIIKAFDKIKEMHPSIELHLYGTPNNQDRSTIESLIERLGLAGRVKLMGRASYEEVSNILANAKILVTSQPITKRAQGGFPTKMCEYMMAEIPTVLTDVGEIHEYVTDGVNAYMVPPCDPDAYAEKLNYILSNYPEALQVAKKAKQYVLENFRSKRATEKLCGFLNN